MRYCWSVEQAEEYIGMLLTTIGEVHFLNTDIFNRAASNLGRYNIKRYNIYDHLIAFSMAHYGIDKLVTLNRKDFEKYDFIKEIITP